LDTPISDPSWLDKPIAPYKTPIYYSHFFAEYHGPEFAEHTDFICSFDQISNLNY